uniref:Uncharacterized protein n=1 Tax=Arundo donax TaxID=35708 RepID=A0A0A9FSQ7_ARUDO
MSNIYVNKLRAERQGLSASGCSWVVQDHSRLQSQVVTLKDV